MSIDRLSSAFVAFAEDQQRCFSFVYKNASAVSSKMSINRSSSDLGAFAKKFALKIDYSELQCCFPFVYKNPSSVSSEMSIDRLSRAFIAFVKNQQSSFSFIDKNLSPVSSEMSIDRLSSAFVAFAEKLALKIDYSELLKNQQEQSYPWLIKAQVVFLAQPCCIFSINSEPKFEKLVIIDAVFLTKKDFTTDNEA
ncbi:hypothetical protein TSAR_015079 [Trichomalopsis sarcophagae]|uniref:Uncharacterized protein n=1 Tax=Trichomalopsis sarcophagae TaxID=543379 RepID=A0A232EGZ9_9HYME|nr:hypothetical protein TSAR_015079 [Trichomalopsis sarcophagae]